MIKNISKLVNTKLMLRFVMQNSWFMWVTMGVMLVCLLSMVCCESVRRKSPINFIFLFIFTICEGLMLGTLATFYSVDAVLISVGITAGVTFALTIFAFQTKIDFTVCGGQTSLYRTHMK